jgi:hypothetical protein
VIFDKAAQFIRERLQRGFISGDVKKILRIGGTRIFTRFKKSVNRERRREIDAASQTVGNIYALDATICYISFKRHHII